MFKTLEKVCEAVIQDIFDSVLEDYLPSNLDTKEYHKKQLDNQITICGKSVAGKGTSFLVRGINFIPYDILFDAGHDLGSNEKNVGIIFISHKDADHTKCLPGHILNSRIKPIIICPISIVEQIIIFVDSAIKLHHGMDHQWSDKCYIVGISENKSITYEVNKKREQSIKIDTFKAFHGRTPCLSYGLSLQTSGLKEEYKGQNIPKLKKEQPELQLFENRIKPIIIYATDTLIQFFGNERVFEYPIIMIECTLLYSDDPLGSKKHIHWDDLSKIVASHPENQFVLFHFSDRYKETEIWKFLKDTKLPNVRPYF